MCVCVCVCARAHVCPGASALTQTLGGPVASALLRAACRAPGADLAQLSEGMWCFLPTLPLALDQPGAPLGCTVHCFLCAMSAMRMCVHVYAGARGTCKGVSVCVCVCVCVVCLSPDSFFFLSPVA